MTKNKLSQDSLAKLNQARKARGLSEIKNAQSKRAK